VSSVVGARFRVTGMEGRGAEGEAGEGQADDGKRHDGTQGRARRERVVSGVSPDEQCLDASAF